MTLGDWADIATIATAAAVMVAILSFIGDKSQRHREFESLYVQRYWAIQDRRSVADRLGSRRLRTRRDQAVALDYLRLCEDELEVRKLGLVTNKTWRVWAPSIASALTDSRNQRLLARRPDEFEHIRVFAVSGQDPYAGNRLWAKWNGL